MLLQLQFYLPLARGWEIMKCLLCMGVCVCVHVCICHIFTQTFISHSFMDISSLDVQRMFMAVKKMSVKKFVLI